MSETGAYVGLFAVRGICECKKGGGTTRDGASEVGTKSNRNRWLLVLMLHIGIL